MNDNRIIRMTPILGKALIGLCLLMYLFFVAIIVYWHFDSSAFDMVNVSRAFEAGFGVNDIQFYINEEQKRGNVVLLSELSPIMIYWLLFRITIFVVLTILMIRKGLRIVSSIRTLRTFYIDNVRHLKSIALLALIAFLFSSFNLFSQDGQIYLHFKTVFGPLILAISCVILAEVFKEGSKLVEEQNLII